MQKYSENFIDKLKKKQFLGPQFESIRDGKISEKKTNVSLYYSLKFISVVMPIHRVNKIQIYLSEICLL